MTKFDEIDFQPDSSQCERAGQISELQASQRVDRETIAELQDRIVEQSMAYERLEGAIATSRRIGAAIGIVMTALKITEDDAFGVLSTISQRQNRKLRDIASDIVLTGTF